LKGEARFAKVSREAKIFEFFPCPSFHSRSAIFFGFAALCTAMLASPSDREP
jgi:hypothetical protein